jgi:hypothetical protein
MAEYDPFDPRTGKPWWERFSHPGGVPEYQFAQREDFYVLIAHLPGGWAGFVGEGKYSSLQINQKPQWQGEMTEVLQDAENYIRGRDPSFKGDWPRDLLG